MDPEELRIANVFPDSGETIDMLVTADERYRPVTRGNPSTGIKGEFLSIGVRHGVKTALSFAFVEGGSALPAKLPGDYAVTIYDLDRPQAVIVQGYKEAKVSKRPKSTVDERTTKRGTKWVGTSLVAGNANPKYVEKLTGQQKAKAVAFEFLSDMSDFKVELINPAPLGGRNFIFGGVSPLICDSDVQMQ